MAKIARQILHKGSGRLTLTDWFHYTTHPVHAGVYEVDGGGWYSWWTGKEWRLPAMSIDGAVRAKNIYSIKQNRPWRGLLAAPDKRDRLAKLMLKHIQFIAKLEQSQHGNDFTFHTFSTPCCHQPLRTNGPKDGGVWDTLTDCPHCGTTFMKWVDNKSVTALLVQDERQ